MAFLLVMMAGLAQEVTKKADKLVVTCENVLQDGGYNAEDIGGPFLDSLFKKLESGNVVYNAPGISLAEIDNMSFSFDKKIEKYLGKIDFKKKWYIGSPDSYWKNLKKERVNFVKEPYVDDFFYYRDSLLDAGKISSKAIWCYFNPVFLKVVHPGKIEKHYAIFVASSINARYKCEPFGGAGYIVDLYEKKNGAWHFVENLAMALN